MKIVITGGAGFIGISLSRTLIDLGYPVVILDRAERISAAWDEIPPCETGILNFPDVSQIERFFQKEDILIHLACTTSPASSMKSIYLDASTNIAASVYVFEAAAKAGVQRVIFASSGGTVYGPPRCTPVDEDHPTFPICGYGVSKLSIERYLGLFDAFTGISLRIANPFGPFQLRGATVGLIARYLLLLSRKKPFEVWGDGSTVRDYLYIDDVVQAFIAAIASPDISSGAYNIGSGRGVSINQIITLIFETTGSFVPVKYLNNRPFDVPSIVLNNTRFCNSTGWAPKVSLKQGIDFLWKELQACKRVSAALY